MSYFPSSFAACCMIKVTITSHLLSSYVLHLLRNPQTAMSEIYINACFAEFCLVCVPMKPWTQKLCTAQYSKKCVLYSHIPYFILLPFYLVKYARISSENFVYIIKKRINCVASNKPFLAHTNCNTYPAKGAVRKWYECSLYRFWLGLCFYESLVLKW